MSDIKNPNRFNLTRRRLLVGAAAATGAASLAYVTHRGVRYPRLTLSPAEQTSTLSTGQGTFDIQGAIFTNIDSNSPVTMLRAIQPEPVVNLLTGAGESTFVIDNVATNAVLTVNPSTQADVSEVRSGLSREITVKANASEAIEFVWVFDTQRKVRFAAIGDSGGGDELPWCLTRAADLGAEFFLHLGDFNYTKGEYDLAVTAFANATIPSYITVGNHDFNDSGLVYQQFLNQLGRFNHSFIVADTEFINIDTAANFLPLKSGQRGRFIANLSPTTDAKVAFSHRPFVDIRPGEDHALGSEAEAHWLHEVLNQIGCNDYLCGHVHKSGETDVAGLNQWTAGEGLGYEDWVARKPVSQILMGTVEPETSPQFSWVALDMPWQVHTSTKHLEKLRKEQSQDDIEWFHKQRALYDMDDSA